MNYVPQHYPICGGETPLQYEAAHSCRLSMYVLMVPEQALRQKNGECLRWEGVSVPSTVPHSCD